MSKSFMFSKSTIRNLVDRFSRFLEFVFFFMLVGVSMPSCLSTFTPTVAAIQPTEKTLFRSEDYIVYRMKAPRTAAELAEKFLGDKEDYLKAIKEFEESLKYNQDCGRCEENIQKSEEIYKDLHYRRGLSYFKDEKLADAIHEWEFVYERDPKYKEVDSSLQKARKMNSILDTIKQKGKN